MSVVIESGSTNQATSGSAVSCNLPSGVVPGNILIAFFVSTAGYVVVPSGYTELGRQQRGFTRQSVMWKLAAVSEPNISTSQGGSGSYILSMIRCSASAGRMFDATCFLAFAMNQIGPGNDEITAPDPGTALTGEIRLATAGSVSGTPSGTGGTAWTALSAQATSTGTALFQRWNGAGGGAAPLIRLGTLNDFDGICAASFRVKDIAAPQRAGLFFGTNH